MDKYSEQKIGQNLDIEVIVLEREDGSTLWIPKDETNSDYRAYLESLKDAAK